MNSLQTEPMLFPSMMMSSLTIIDAHIHHYPQAARENPAAWARDMKENHWMGLMQSNALQGWPTLEQLLEGMDRAHVQRAILQGWYWENLATCVECNQWQAQWVREHPQKFIGFASIQPLAGERAMDALKKAYDDGLKGIGEVFPAAQGFPMNHPTWLKMIAWATDRAMPITLHVPEPVGHAYAGNLSAPLSDYQWLAENFPETIFIFAHWGGLLPFYELNAHCKKAFKNVYYDTAASPLLYDKRVYKAVVELIGSERILFGSDYPLRTFPKRQTQPDFEHAIAEVKAAGLSDEATANLLSKNALRLLDSMHI